jgi:hypothetical protein
MKLVGWSYESVSNITVKNCSHILQFEQKIVPMGEFIYLKATDLEAEWDYESYPQYMYRITKNPFKLEHDFGKDFPIWYEKDYLYLMFRYEDECTNSYSVEIKFYAGSEQDENKLILKTTVQNCKLTSEKFHKPDKKIMVG